MRTSFLIVCSDEAPLLEHSLRAAVAEGFDSGLVIDNASTDATAEVAADHGTPRLGLDRRVPYTEAMNRGLAAAQGEVVAMLQADTFLDPGYLAAGVRPFADPTVGSVAPKLLRTLGPRIDERLPLIDAAAMSFDRRRKNALVGHGRPASAYASRAEAFGADGAGALWRREALRDCMIEDRAFDENMPGWGCDADLAWRAQLLGWRAIYEPTAVVHHIRSYSPTTRALATPADRRTQFRNRLLMMAKNDAWDDLSGDLGTLLGYEFLALGYALLRERELLGGYREALARLPEARRQRAIIQRRRRVARVPLGLEPPA